MVTTVHHPTNPPGTEVYSYTNPNGTALYIDTSGTRVYGAPSLNGAATGGDVENLSYDGVLVDVSAAGFSLDEVVFSPDLSKFFAPDSNRVYTFTMSSPGDITTATLTHTYIGPASGYGGVAFNPDGTRAFITSAFATDVVQLDLSTPYDFSTAVDNSDRMDVAGKETAPTGIEFSQDGTKLFITGFNSDSIHQYNLSTAWDVVGGTYSGTSLALTGVSVPRGMSFDPSHTKLYLVNINADALVQINFATPDDLATAVQGTSVSLAPAAQPAGVYHSPTNEKVYILNTNYPYVYQFSLPNA